MVTFAISPARLGKSNSMDQKQLEFECSPPSLPWLRWRNTIINGQMAHVCRALLTHVGMISEQSEDDQSRDRRKSEPISSAAACTPPALVWLTIVSFQTFKNMK